MTPIGQTWCAYCGVALHRDEAGTYVPAGEHRRDCPSWQPVSGSPESDRRKRRNAWKRARRAIRAAGGQA